jgi:hypothetical protein
LIYFIKKFLILTIKANDWNFVIKKFLIKILKRLLKLILIGFLYHLYIYYYDRKDLIHDPNIFNKIKNFREMVNLLYKVTKINFFKINKKNF